MVFTVEHLARKFLNIQCSWKYVHDGEAVIYTILRLVKQKYAMDYIITQDTNHQNLNLQPAFYVNIYRCSIDLKGIKVVLLLV